MLTPSFEITSNLIQKFINNPRLAVFMLLVISATLVISAQLFSKYISQKKIAVFGWSGAKTCTIEKKM